MLRRLLMAILISAAGIATAAPLARYELVLRVGGATQVDPGFACDDSLPGSMSFGCVEIGSVFRGSFAVDESILASDGAVSDAAIHDLHLAFGQALYSSGPDNITLAMFRNMFGFADAPTFIVESGEVVGLYGAFVGPTDWPYIEFLEPGRFAASDGILLMSGDLEINRVPAPGSLSLVALALLGVVLPRPRLRAATDPRRGRLPA
jgi:hypothetical protein